MTDSVDAWRSFCERMGALGERLLAEDFPADASARAEGVHHLANQVACWLTHALGHTDPARPAFFRSFDPVYRWGGPNVDQVARRATISGAGTYRISGNMGSCEEFALQLKAGAVQTGGADVETEVSASSLGLHPGDDFELLLSPHEQPGTWLVTHPDIAFVHVRDYYFDWQARQPATFVIERLDAQEPPTAMTPERVGALLEDAAHQVEHSLGFWNEYQERMRAGQELNAFGPPAGAARGVQDLLYSHAFVSVPEGSALLLELDATEAELWDVALYNRVWYEPLDFAHRVTSLNHRQARSDVDGSVRIAITGADPGVANWLDTEGRSEVLATVRWWHPPSTPSIAARVMPVRDLPSVLPKVTPDERRAEIAQRSAHVAWRFRT